MYVNAIWGGIKHTRKRHLVRAEKHQLINNRNALTVMSQYRLLLHPTFSQSNVQMLFAPEHENTRSALRKGDTAEINPIVKRVEAYQEVLPTTQLTALITFYAVMESEDRCS